METIVLTVNRRDPIGRRSARVLRRNAQVPGIFYGPGTTAVPVVVGGKELTLKLGRVEGSQLIRFASTDADLEGKMVLLKEVQLHPPTGTVLHADFYAVDPNRRLRVRAALHFTGKPPGVTAGGILQPLRRDILVECLPSAIPGALEVDVSELGIHDTIHVAQLVLPEGVEAVADTNYALVTVLPPTVEAVEAPAEAAAEGAAAPAEGAAAGAAAGSEETKG